MPEPTSPLPELRGTAPTDIATVAARVRAEWKLLAVGCLCLAATNALGLAIPWLLKVSVDGVRSLGLSAGAVASPQAVYALVVRNAALIIAAAVGQALIRTGSRVFIFNAGRNIEYGLRRDLFAHLLRMDAGFFRRHATGDIMSRLTSDLSAVRMLFGPGILNVFNTALIYGAGIWLLWGLSPRLTLIAVLPYPALILAARVSSRRVYAVSRALQEELGALSTAVHEDVAGIAVVRSYTLEETRHAAFRERSRRYLERALAVARARGVMAPLFAMIGAAGTLIVLWAGGHEVIAGRLTLGGLVAFNAYLVYLAGPTISFGWILAVWQRGLAAWMRVRELLAVSPAISDGTSDSEAGVNGGAAIQPSIAIQHLTVEDRLRDVSLAVPAGSNVAIVGRTGGGKSTLVEAVLRLIDVPRGALSVGGIDVHDLSLGSLRRLVGYAPQEAFLFSASVADNVAFGLPDGLSDDERRARVLQALDAAGFTHDLALLPSGVDTIVGERGITLSGGQRQRVALARALAVEPKILILDDALSSVDAETERAILTRLRPILRGRTSLIVSHRVAAVRDCDEILVMDRGAVAERGTHTSLIAARGLYADLYREQLATEAS